MEENRATPEAVEVRGICLAYGAGPTVLDRVDLAVRPGSVLALLGPSGCGKTTLLRVVAGLEAPNAGEVVIGDRRLTGPGVLVPPERRRVGMVFQDWGLFPHLSVADNIGYGLPRAERGREARRVVEALEMVGLAGLAGRLPGTLSGGQQQRVALARALAPRPAVLLLDEPFSNLDTVLRVQVRSEVHRLLDELEVTTIFVTHDQDEAFVLGDEVAVMGGGAVVQQGTPAVLYEAPSTPWVASFVGEANLLSGTARGSAADTVVGAVSLRDPTDGPVEVLVRPELVEVVAGDDGVVQGVEYYGHDTVYLVDLDGVPLRARTSGPPLLRRGARVAVSYRGRATIAWPA